VLVIERTREGDRVLDTTFGTVYEGEYLVELWQDGERLEASNGSSEQWARRHTAQIGPRYVNFQVYESRLDAWQNFSSTHYYANITLTNSDRVR
jgi:hypothetical protein